MSERNGDALCGWRGRGALLAARAVGQEVSEYDLRGKNGDDYGRVAGLRLSDGPEFASEGANVRSARGTLRA